MWYHPVVLAARAFYGLLVFFYTFLVGLAVYEVARISF